MTRGVLLAWTGTVVAALAILTALFWPMDAELAPAPVANPTAVPAVPPPPSTSVVPPPTSVVPGVDVVSTSRARVAPSPAPARTRSGPSAPATGPVQAAPADTGRPTNKGNGEGNTNGGDGGDNGDNGGLFPDGF